MVSVFFDISIVVIIAVLVATAMKFLKQPLIIGHIITGILIGPYIFNMMGAEATLETFSHIGIAFLLFIVGLSLDLRTLKNYGKVSLFTGLGQIIFTSAIGFIVSILLGFSFIASIYISVALTFSSTIIIMKLLSDKGDLESLYGKISVGFLVVQDLVAIMIMIFLSAVPSGITLYSLLSIVVLKGVVLMVVLFLIAFYVFPKITSIFAKSQEFLLLFSTGWCFAVASLFFYLGFSIEAGALMAGITLSLSPYRYEISSKMRTLRDFFIVMFFILLGSQMVFSSISNYIVPAILLSAFILIGNPIIVMTIMGLLGFKKRTGFMAGLTVAQISEFSLILVAMGVTMGHVSKDILSLVTVVGLITIAGSTYMIIYSDKIFKLLSGVLSVFERKDAKNDQLSNVEYDHFLFGCNRIGYDVLSALKRYTDNVLVVDYNPQVIVDLNEKKIPCKYGDLSDYELLKEINISNAKLVVSTVPHKEHNLLLLSEIRKNNPNALVVLTADYTKDALELYNAGADYVILPHLLSGFYVSRIMENLDMDKERFDKERVNHIRFLEQRAQRDHEYM